MPAILLQTLDETRALGVALGRQAKAGDVVLLSGSLGAGKTTLTQFIAEGLEVPEDNYVTSPSFALMHEYSGRIPLYHIDCYRLDHEDDVEESGLIDYIVADGISVVEWPDRLGSLVPAQRLDIAITMAENDARRVQITAHGECWQKRLDDVIRAVGQRP